MINRVELGPGVFHLQSGTNVGLVVRDGRALLVDTGLDEDAARRALRAVEESGATLEAVFVTHAHADHCGGAHFLQRRLAVPLYAPVLEGAMMENPVIEPLALFGGAAPIEELRTKFTLAKSCQVDHVVEAPESGSWSHPLEIGPFQVEVVPLRGHSANQMGVAVGQVLFCADAIYPEEVLEKHKIPFCVDVDEALETLARLPGLPYTRFAPGHGPAYACGDEIADACLANQERLEEIREQVCGALEQPQETRTLVRHAADHFRLQLDTVVTYFFVRTTVLAALSSLERAGRVTAAVRENGLWWQRPSRCT